MKHSLVTVRDRKRFNSSTILILYEMVKIGKPVGPTLLANRIGRSISVASRNLTNLHEAGMLDRLNGGIYRLTERGIAEANLYGQTMEPTPSPTITTPLPKSEPENHWKEEARYWRDKFVELSFLIASKPNQHP